MVGRLLNVMDNFFDLGYVSGIFRVFLGRSRLVFFCFRALLALFSFLLLLFVLLDLLGARNQIAGRILAGVQELVPLITYDWLLLLQLKQKQGKNNPLDSSMSPVDVVDAKR